MGSSPNGDLSAKGGLVLQLKDQRKKLSKLETSSHEKQKYPNLEEGNYRQTRKAHIRSMR